MGSSLFPTRRDFLLGVMACAGANALAVEPKEKVQWAGVSLAGQWENAPNLMPTVHGLYTDERFRLRLNERAAVALREVGASHSNFQFVTEGAMLREGSDALALTLAITGEFVSVIEAQGADGVPFQELSIRLRGLVMMANVSKDPNRQKIVCSYPIRTAYRKRLSAGSKSEPGEVRNIVSAMLLGELGLSTDFVARFKERLPALAIRGRDEWISVSPLRVNAEAASRAGLSPAQVDLASALASSVIESGISIAANIPIVPASIDGAITELKLSFADRGGMAFRTPDPSYSLDVSVYVLASQSAEQRGQTLSGYMTRFVGGFQVDYFSIDPEKRRTSEVSLRLQKQAAITYLGTSADARKFDPAQQYIALITLFSEELSLNLIPANDRWLEQQKAGSEKRSPRELGDLIRAKLPQPSKGA